MIANIIIASLVAVSTGIFAWLFFLKMYDKLTYYKDTVEELTTNKFSELFLFIDISNYFYYYIAALLIFPIIAGSLSGDISLGILTFLVILFSPYLILKEMIKKRLKKFEQQLPDALVMVAGSIRSGSSLPIALDSLIKESSPPLSQEFGLYVRERKLGLDRDKAFDNLERRVPLEDLSLSLSAIRISSEIGGDLAETLESLAETLRKKLVMEGKIDSLTSQGKLQGIVMSTLPLFLIVALMKLEPAAMGQMFTTKIGWMVLATIVCMQVLGFIAIRKITAIDV
ncbi:Flp pilus assembly protein TadB [Desulfocapsa sulfexigens DSM 10523]|uniref:Flp pilus assembly protein TadB n=1 Tax=Desulfocapsa sulfexigens (strain DSM 10523 / SB164P1) TaxID=1167006 RepID=M1PAM5_DESSD|nr:type II secretion system F family protein [Desulfocapsa sulfexigens]AGF76840.1 Flp pilus assembly protein TadB [Desulfocapsa sulfexigens DSM 10523]